MSKGLEALEKLYCAGRLDLDYVCSDKHKNDYSIVEKELKALEIIKEKRIDVDYLMACIRQKKNDVLYFYNEFMITLHGIKLTQEECDLLKEVLE